MVEQPRDPKEWREDDYALHGGHGYPSFLCWPETDRVLVAYDDVIEVRVDQGALGHKRKKPTTLVTNIHEVKLLNGLQRQTPCNDLGLRHCKLGWRSLDPLQSGPQS